MDPSFAITAFATMFVIVDPIGTTPIFIALTQGQTAKQRRSIAVRACALGLFLLAMFAFFGDVLLGFIGISMPAFKIAGGLLLFLTALEMLFQRRSKRRADQTGQEEYDDPSVFPLAIPLLAGPGGITSIILLSEQAASPIEMAVVMAMTATVLLVAFLMFLLAGPIERGLGETGVLVITRLLGMLLAALSVQFVMDGLVAFGLAG